MYFRSVCVTVRTSGDFVREIEEDMQRIDAHFSTHPQLVAAGHDFNMDQLRADLDSRIENLNARGSGFTLESVTEFTLVITCLLYTSDAADE